MTDKNGNNLINSLVAKQMGVRRVISKVNDENLVPIFEKAGVDVAISPKTAVVNELKNKIIEKSSNILLTVEQNQAEVIEADVPEKFFDKQIKDIKFPIKAIVGIIKRGKKIIIPKGNTLLRVADRMIIFAKSVDIQKLKEFLQ